MKKVLILTVIAILALGVMAMAGHVAGTATGASSHTTVNATINVYQWFDYSIIGENATISNVGSSTIIKLADASVKSNGTLHVLYSVTTIPGGLIGLSTWKYGGSWDSATLLTFGSISGEPGVAGFYLNANSSGYVPLTDISLWTNYMSQTDGEAGYNLVARRNTYSIELIVQAQTTF